MGDTAFINVVATEVFKAMQAVYGPRNGTARQDERTATALARSTPSAEGIHPSGGDQPEGELGLQSNPPDPSSASGGPPPIPQSESPSRKGRKQRKPKNRMEAIARTFGDPASNLDRLRHGQELLKRAQEALPHVVASGQVGFEGDYVPTQIARYTAELELYRDYYMSRGEYGIDQACQVIMVLLKYHVQLFSGRGGHRAKAVETMQNEDLEAQVREMSDEELRKG